MGKIDIWNRIKDDKPFFIAEIGKNFITTKEEKTAEEYLQVAKSLIDQAKAAGADAVKFQTHRGEDEQVKIMVESPHFKGADRYSWVMRNAKATPDWWWAALSDYARENGIIFFSTPMSRAAAMVLDKVGVPLWKVGSGDILDFVMLDYIRRTDKPIIISSGMSTLAELDKSLQFIMAWNKRVALLHCISKYPCPKSEVRVGTIKFFQKRYGIPVGFSDHSLGVEAVRQAVKCGAKIIEKHFSMSRDNWGADHKVSITPAEYGQMVEVVREGGPVEDDEELLGEENIIELPDNQSEFRGYFRKSLVAGKDIKRGEVISANKVYAMRPQALIGGLPSEKYEDVVGKVAEKDIVAGTAIEKVMLVEKIAIRN